VRGSEKCAIDLAEEKSLDVFINPILVLWRGDQYFLFVGLSVALMAGMAQ
jgi:hypothetical protein